MQCKAASLGFAIISMATLAGASISQAYQAPVEEPRTVRDAVINRDIVAETQLYCLALAVYFEGGSTAEPEIGQRHVARVVVARAAANRAIWGGSNICDVVFYQRKKTCQFSFACLPAARRTPRGGAAWAYSVSVAQDELEGRSTVEENLIRYYMNAALSAPKNACRFRKEFMPVVQAGRHEFFREASAAERRELEKGDYAECRKYAESLRKKKPVKAKAKKGTVVAAKQPPGKKVTVARR